MFLIICATIIIADYKYGLLTEVCIINNKSVYNTNVIYNNIVKIITQKKKKTMKF